MADAFQAPRVKDPEMNRALRHLTQQLNTLLGGVSAGSISMVRTSGGGSGAASKHLRAISGATIDLYVYKTADPDNPDESIGSTSTDGLGFWEYDLASFCWTNEYNNPFMVTYKRDGEVMGHRTAPDHFWKNAAGDGFRPIMVEGRELTT